MMVNYYLKENINMEKEMEKEKDIMKMVYYRLKENIKMEKKMDMEQNMVKIA